MLFFFFFFFSSSLTSTSFSPLPLPFSPIKSNGMMPFRWKKWPRKVTNSPPIKGSQKVISFPHTKTDSIRRKLSLERGYVLQPLPRINSTQQMLIGHNWSAISFGPYRSSSQASWANMDTGNWITSSESNMPSSFSMYVHPHGFFLASSCCLASSFGKKRHKVATGRK